MTMKTVNIIGGGLAGCEAAWQLAKAGVRVRLCEMKPHQRTAAQSSNDLAELVCSNSLRSSNVQNAVGLLKEEMRRLDSLIISAATKARVPAGDALAVDRQRFSAEITNVMDGHPNIERRSEVVCELSDTEPTIVATGPLTTDALAQEIARRTGQERLYFYDAIAPIVSAESLDRSVIFAASRYDKGDGADYLNCPLSKEHYEHFVDALLGGEYMPLHSFEEPKYFQGCLPIEVVAAGGRDSLRFGCMKPVGLVDPHTHERPFAVLQLRQEDLDAQAYNLVGFQTKLKYPEQKRIFQTIPGLKNAEFLRFGAIHRNTYLDSPSLLNERMRLVSQPNILFAGQITGVEGYVESAAHGLLCAKLLASDITSASTGSTPLGPPPKETALGALWRHVTGEQRLAGRPHEPANINWSMFPNLDAVHRRQRKVKRVAVAIKALERWAGENRLALGASQVDLRELEKGSRKRT